MKRTLLILSAAGLLSACGGNGRKQAAATDPAASASTEVTLQAPDMHTAETSLDYLGTYEGTLPGADCPGIRTTIVLAADGSYTLHMEYLERDTAYDEKGSFEVKGNLLTLTPSDGGQPGYYKVEENRLRHLDGDRQPITGELAEHYVLQKK
ncbi:MAG TPA: copper resistance protein NlpE [Candidatus Alistipes intestinigallinarum]|uniref:Copper resistance protein NlpE n=1 Tax=Candidatus Alistipes intestinigallinarum TaxID=2838440 RepID=A0A9D1Z0M6_9BACT|nr:copper resistance protein NlpE [Candidatus Alistipes intestinigallinarum]